MAKKLFVIAGQSNALGRGTAASITVWPGGVTAPYSNVLYLEHSATGADPPTFQDSNGGVAYALQPRTSTIISQVAGTCGVELTLGRVLDAAFPGQCVLLKIAIDGSGLENKWLPVTSPVFPTGGPQWFGTYVNYIIAAQTTFGALMAGSIWIQGGTDANEIPDAANYGTNMGTFYGAQRATALGQFPIVFDRLHASAGVVDAPSVRAGQAAFAAATSRCTMINADDLVLSDAVHYDSNSLGTLGIRFGNALAGLVASGGAGVGPGVKVGLQ